MSLNDTNGVPKGIIDHGKKRDRKYKPNFPKDMPRLPPIDAFRLDHILQDDLKGESQEVINAMMNVASSYQNDLKSEIRRKLSIEQKIQFKNIEIAKIAHSLSKSISVRNKKLRRAISNNGSNSNTGNNNSSSLLLLGNDSTIDDEILMLLELSAKASSKIRVLTQKLSKIDQRVNRTRRDEILTEPNSHRKIDYPYIHKMLSQKQRQKSTSKVSNENHAEVPIKVLVSPPMEPVEPNNKTNNTPKSDPALPTIKTQDEEEMDAEQFELFMSSSISKYRDLQLGKYGEVDIFLNTPNQNTSNNANESPVSRTSNSSTYASSFKSGNPLSLLYSSIIEKPQVNEQRLTVLPSIGNMTINVKSSATVKPTLQTSHFKKLRINGSPITSETFLKMKEKPTCECTDHDDDDHLSHCSDRSEDSMAKRALTDSLHAFESLHLSSDDTSGLNTETDDNDLVSEPPMTSESSDFDSDSLSSVSGDNRPTTYADQYYLFLKEDMKKRKRLHRRRKLLLRRRPMYQRKDLSPTPKHKPSHHSLKPKRSILKMPSTKMLRHDPPTDAQRKEIAKTDNILVQHHLNDFTSCAFETSGIKARPRVGSNSTNEFTVRGTMLHVGPETEESSSYDNDDNEVILWDGVNNERRADNSDVVSLKSISRLKSFL